ncbi:MAG: class I tRNA ligase family protein, partial [Vicingaceae bacterium]
MEYNFPEIEKKWQAYWAKNKTFKAIDQSEKPKFYVLDMFPYPSGAGLHVGHPLGYIASDIYARYNRHKGFNVLHPMGYDSFGLPAEQYAIQTGQHPKITTEENISTYRRQLDQIGFSFDWDREVRTSNPEYYKWTQWIFLQLFNSWYNKAANCAEDIQTLIAHFEKSGTTGLKAHSDSELSFTVEEWKNKSEKEQADILMDYRLAFLADSYVNWCPALGTVLANDEIKDGVSERGGHPVERKKMKQWSMRITAYAERLLQGLDQIDWSDALKEIQRNWIGKSKGASIRFAVENSKEQIEVFTTRPDTIFGVSFMVLAPEHDLVSELTTAEQKEEVDKYQKYAAARSERERMTEVKKVTGAFTGAYAIHPFSGEKMPIWIGDYVLASYGTGAVMAVPSGDQRDWDFANSFGLEIPPVIEGQNVSQGAEDRKDGKLINSDFLNGLPVKEAIAKSIEAIEEKEIGAGKINYRLRDAVFSRQRYWGEPIPIYYEDEIAKAYPEEKLPLELPEVDKYLPTEDGEPPLARAKDWSYNGNPLEASTMPGWAGSSWYLYRYMDAERKNGFADKESLDYWKNVDLYFGGAEHATGHLLYSRFWCKFLKDRGHLKIDEPFQKLINQGMIGHHANYIHKAIIDFEIENSENEFAYRAATLKLLEDFPLYVDYKIVENFKKGDMFDSSFIPQLTDYKKFIGSNVTSDKNIINYPKFIIISFTKTFIPTSVVNNNNTLNKEDFNNQQPTRKKDKIYYLQEGDSFYCEREDNVKMSKSKYNVVNPDDIVADYGADTLRLFEMFLGPIEQSKPWDMDSIEGVHRFLRKFWRLFHDGENNLNASDEKATADELKALHKCIKKVTEDIERFSFNTGVSTFMICVNELNDLNCQKREILEPLCVLIAPYAPHIAEELWKELGHDESVSRA